MFLFTFSHNNVKDILSLTYSYLKHAKLGVFLSIVRERDAESTSCINS